MWRAAPLINWLARASESVYDWGFGAAYWFFKEVGLELRSRYLLGRGQASPSLTGMVQLLKFIVTTRWVLAAWIHQQIIHLTWIHQKFIHLI
jgi:hypothetical protein